MTGKESFVFKITLEDKLFDVTTFGLGNSYVLEVLENPYKKWYKRAFEFITLSLYKAPWEYKVKII